MENIGQLNQKIYKYRGNKDEGIGWKERKNGLERKIWIVKKKGWIEKKERMGWKEKRMGLNEKYGLARKKGWVEKKGRMG